MDARTQARSPPSVEGSAPAKSSAAGRLSSREAAVLLLERIRLLEAVAENFPGGISMFDRRLRMVLCNRRLKELLDYPEDLFAQGTPTLEELFRYNARRGEYGPGNVEELVGARMALVHRRVPHVYERTRPCGTVLEVRGVPLEHGGFLTTYVDVTEERQRMRHLDAVVANFPGGICMFDRQLRMVVCNARLKAMLDYPDELFASGNPTLEDLFRYNARRGEYGPGEEEEQVQKRLALVVERRAHEYERARPNGAILEVRGIPLEGGGFVTTYLDVTERHRVEARTAHLAHHDPLTDLPNRLLLRDRLTHALAHVKRGARLALHYLDLDRFKPVNDTLGHAVGDALLKAVAERLRRSTREVDTVARIGGDEFILIQAGLNARQDAEVLARRLVAAMAEAFDVEGHRVSIGVTIGIAIAPEHGTTPEELMAKSDIALYEAKAAGRGRFEFAR